MVVRHKQVAMDGLKARKRLGATASMLALTVAVQLAATGAMAQTTVAPASRDDTSTPQTDVPPQTDDIPAGSNAGKRSVSGSTSIENQGTVDQSNVTASDIQTPGAVFHMPYWPACSSWMQAPGPITSVRTTARPGGDRHSSMLTSGSS